MKNYFVTRDKDNNITTISSTAQETGQEQLDADNLEIVAFFATKDDKIYSEQLVQEEMRKLAIASLKTKGQLAQDYE